MTGVAVEHDAAPSASGARRWRIALAIAILAAAVWAAGRASAAGASWPRAFALIGGLPWVQILGLGVLWILGLYVHTIVLASSLPGLSRRRALTLNLTGSAVSNVLPLGGLAGTALNLTMTASWGHSRLDFARFVVVSKACDIVAKLFMPAVALAALLATGALTTTRAAPWAIPVAGAVVAGALLLWALCGRATALLHVVGLAAHACSWATRGRVVGTTWAAGVRALLEGTDVLVRRRRVALALGMAGYWLAQGALLWCCLTAVGLRPPAAVVFAGLVVERAMTLLPITPGGTGPAEAGMVTILLALGVDPTGALAGVLLFRSFVFAAEIPVGAAVGLGWWVTRRLSARRDSAGRRRGAPPVCA
ncbi:lysylphosphatidylglycerol synthase transmembrane domain-containing protein [Actinoplanes subtropicus]|uniref:lysylphosphatidylglycerol synthase transmembrane domain-containing protein n=1 Tax=Actinoplanes subtropicus TaxID=543632 RepID=UPI0004C3A260|nr:lysylphosphatidylglycerol synthase transmembrane domain-containing protein [Actinoplanes subtropicus]